jgi:hypothetical protein
MRTSPFIFFLLLMASCRHPSQKEKLAAYVNDPANKITQRIEKGGVQVTAKFFPEDYNLILNKSRGDSTAWAASGDGFYYFDIKFDKQGTDKPSKEKLLYMDFDMQKDFVLLAGLDSVPSAICQKIENGVAGSYEFMVGFERPVAQEDFSLFYNDKIFGTGTLAFVYNKKDVMKIPRLKTSKAQ